MYKFEKDKTIQFSVTVYVPPNSTVKVIQPQKGQIIKLEGILNSNANPNPYFYYTLEFLDTGVQLHQIATGWDRTTYPYNFYLNDNMRLLVTNTHTSLPLRFKYLFKLVNYYNNNLQLINDVIHINVPYRFWVTLQNAITPVSEEYHYVDESLIGFLYPNTSTQFWFSQPSDLPNVPFWDRGLYYVPLSSTFANVLNIDPRSPRWLTDLNQKDVVFYQYYPNITYDLLLQRIISPNVVNYDKKKYYI